MSTRYQYIEFIKHNDCPDRLFDNRPWSDYDSARGHLGEGSHRYYGRINGMNTRIDWGLEGIDVFGRSRRSLQKLVWEVKRRICVQARR